MVCFVDNDEIPIRGSALARPGFVNHPGRRTQNAVSVRERVAIETAIILQETNNVGIQYSEYFVELGLHLELPLKYQVRWHNGEDTFSYAAGSKLFECHASFDCLTQADFVAQKKTMRIFGDYLVNHRNLVRFEIYTNLPQRNEVVVMMPLPIPSRYFLEPVFLK